MFKRYPFVKQRENKDCAIACIEMIFKYYKGFANKEELYDLTKTNNNGTTAYHIIETLKYYDFTSKGLKCEINDLGKFNLPLICHVILNNTYKHYIVIYEVNKNYLIIADPAYGIRRIKWDEFSKIFNNVVITMSPQKTLPKYQNHYSKINYFLNIVKNYKKLLIKIVTLSIIITLLSIVNSFYFKYIIDGITTNKDYLLFILILFTHLGILNIFTGYFRNKLLIIINQNIDMDLTFNTLKQIINLPYRYYCNRTTGDIVSRISDLDEVRNAISKVFLTLFVDIILVFGALIFLYYLSDKLFIISLIVFILYLILLLIFKRLLKPLIHNCKKEKANVTSYMVEVISNYDTIKGINIKNSIYHKFTLKYKDYLKSVFKLDNLYNIEILLKDIINDIFFYIILYLGSLEVIKGNLSVGELLTFNSLLLYFLEPIKEIINLDNIFNSAKSALDRIIDLYYEEKDNGVFNNIEGDIKINNLSYTYDNIKYLFKNINLNIKQKEKLLIIGQSGSGKSTLLKILKNYYKVDREKIFINNIDINDYNNNAFNDVCYISQNENLFTDTLYNNITLGRKIDSKKINDVSKLCNIDFIDNNLGYNMLIEENGFNISGGQKQRIILARSLLSNFNILLIDEALNQMDEKLERKILKKIFDVYSNKTIIVVSHRNTNVDLFNRVVKLEL